MPIRLARPFLPQRGKCRPISKCSILSLGLAWLSACDRFDKGEGHGRRDQKIFGNNVDAEIDVLGLKDVFIVLHV